MSKIPVVSGKRVLKVLMGIGYYIRDQEGSHIHLRHPDRLPLTVPNHREIARGTLRAIIKNAGLSVEQFSRLLRE